MLKANELRIGNIVSQNGFFGYVYSIESALPREEERFSDKEVITLFDNGLTTVPIEEIISIRLNERWLMRFGFKYDEFISPMYRPKAYSISGMTLYKESEIFCYSHIKLTYVHQLQNLYFALTGEELVVVD